VARRGIVYGTVAHQANWLITNLNGGVFKDKRIISREDFGADVHASIRPIQGGIEGIWGMKRPVSAHVVDRGGVTVIVTFAQQRQCSWLYGLLLGNRDRKLGFAILTNGNRAHRISLSWADRAIWILLKRSNHGEK